MGPTVDPRNEKAAPGVHPKKGVIDLAASINFPNVKFDKTELKFGAVLNDTTRRIKVCVYVLCVVKHACTIEHACTIKHASTIKHACIVKHESCVEM